MCPAVSRSQQQAAAIAKAAKDGKTKPSKLKGPSKEMYDDMKDKDLKDFAGTDTKGLPDKVKKEGEQIVHAQDPRWGIVELDEAASESDLDVAKMMNKKNIGRLRTAFGSINKVNPDGPAWKKIKALLKKSDERALKIVSDAKPPVKFLSMACRGELARREATNEGQFDKYKASDKEVKSWKAKGSMPWEKIKVGQKFKFTGLPGTGTKISSNQYKSDEDGKKYKVQKDTPVQLVKESKTFDPILDENQGLEQKWIMDEGTSSGTYAYEKHNSATGPAAELPASKYKGDEEEPNIDDEDPSNAGGVKSRTENFGGPGGRGDQNMIDKPDEYDEECDEAKGYNPWYNLMGDGKFEVRGTVGKTSNKTVGSFATKAEAVKVAKKTKDGKVINMVSNKTVYEGNVGLSNHNATMDDPDEDPKGEIDEAKFAFKPNQSIKYMNKPWTVKNATKDWVEIEDKRGYTTIIDFDEIVSFKGGTVMVERNIARLAEELERYQRMLGDEYE